MSDHRLQMNSNNGSYCNLTYHHNQPMRPEHRERIDLVPPHQNLINENVGIAPPAYPSQPVYNQHLQHAVPVGDSQGYMYLQPNHMNEASSLYQTTNNVAYEQPHAYSSHVNYLQQSSQEQMPLANQYNSIPSGNIPQMHDPYQQYCMPTMQPRQMNNSDQIGCYPDQQDILSQDLDYRHELIDESQLIYQQPMDLHPTIKQQHQQQQELQRRSQQETVVRNQISASSSDVSASIGIGTYCNNNQQLANSSLDVRPMNNLVVSQNRSIPRSKSDLEASDIKSTYEHFNNVSRLQNPRSLSSTIPYTNQHQRMVPSIQPDRRQQNFDMRSGENIQQDWLDTICNQLIEHMDRFGICVVDNFLGPLKGELILREVQQLYNSGQYTKGRLVGDELASRALGTDTGIIRSDRVIWIDGCENGCEEINNLIQTLCSVITNSSRLSLYSNNGLDKIVINKRTKAHVACYPGNGTRYIKHVDNPNGDGRVITSIYYLNKDWNTKRDGGLLRMFPAGIDEVANIEPLFDRVLFFWSDRRNPHEVLPAYRDRFAITVWYISENQTT